MKANKVSYRTLEELKKIVIGYADSIISGEIVANIERKQGCERFKRMLNDDRYYLDWEEVLYYLNITENYLHHLKGETIDGKGLNGQPLKLEPFEIFIFANLMGMKVKETKLTLFREAFIYMARKNGKTTFAAALAFAFALKSLASGSTTCIAAGFLKQAKESFDFLKENLTAKRLGKANVILKDNNHGHTLKFRVGTRWATIEALVPRDSYNANFVIFDELHLAKKQDDYTLMRDATKAYANKLVVAITTSGLNVHHFSYYHFLQQQRVVKGEEENEKMFVFIAKADEQGERSLEEYLTDPKEHQKANPNLGVTVSAEDMMTDARSALGNPLAISNFKCKSLNLYIPLADTYFNMDEVKQSDINNVEMTLEDLLALKLPWFGGADLSKLHDLTAAALTTKYNGVQYVITSGFYPKHIAEERQQNNKRALPFTYYQEKGWINLSDTKVVDVHEVVDWFKEWRARGLNIKEIGFDRKFSAEFFHLMTRARFKMREELQTALNKSEGFREIERNIKGGKFRYFSNELYEYCISNVKAVETYDDVIKYEKVKQDCHIDLFDASVFATVRMVRAGNKRNSIDGAIKLFNMSKEAASDEN